MCNTPDLVNAEHKGLINQHRYFTAINDIPMHLTTDHVVGFLDVIGLIRLSATCRKWYAVRRSVLIAEQSQSAATPIEYAGSLDFSPHRAHRYALWLSVCPRPLVEAIVDRYGKEYPTDVLEAMVMVSRRKTLPGTRTPMDWALDCQGLAYLGVAFLS